MFVRWKPTHPLTPSLSGRENVHQPGCLQEGEALRPESRVLACGRGPGGRGDTSAPESGSGAWPLSRAQSVDLGVEVGFGWFHFVWLQDAERLAVYLHSVAGLVQHIDAELVINLYRSGLPEALLTVKVLSRVPSPGALR